MIQAEVSQSTSISRTFYDSAVELREKAKDDVNTLFGEELEFEKILKEEEVEDNGNNEKEMARTDSER